LINTKKLITLILLILLAGIVFADVNNTVLLGKLNEMDQKIEDLDKKVDNIQVGQNLIYSILGTAYSRISRLFFGWVSSSSPYPSVVGIKQGLSSIDGCYTSVFSYQNGIWKSYSPDRNGTLDRISPGFGYWIKVNCTQIDWQIVTLTEICGNGFDDDLDGLIDCDDSDCDGHISCIVCGNGVTEFPEECDDGNTLSGDGCSSTCKIEPCPCITYNNYETYFENLPLHTCIPRLTWSETQFSAEVCGGFCSNNVTRGCDSYPKITNAVIDPSTNKIQLDFEDWMLDLAITVLVTDYCDVNISNIHLNATIETSSCIDALQIKDLSSPTLTFDAETVGCSTAGAILNLFMPLFISSFQPAMEEGLLYVVNQTLIDGTQPALCLCENNICDPTEDCGSCPADCGACVCGDGTCDSSEDCSTCPEDCGECTCGDGTCEGDENCFNCQADCGPCFCGNGACDPNEDCATCEEDCGACVCGDGTCDATEDCASCESDCGPCICGDGTCDATEDCATCEADCGACICGDDVCDPTEDCATCEEDCGACICGDGTCDATETCYTCPHDCGNCPPEVCDGVDNDFDGQIDEEPDATQSCQTVPHANKDCFFGQCVIQSCYSGYNDLNNIYSDGCECQDDGTEYDNSCSLAVNLGTISDNGETATQAGRLSYDGDEDYYVFFGEDTNDILPPDDFYVRVFFTSNPEDEFEFKVYKGSSLSSCGSLQYTGTDFSQDGTYGVEDSGYYHVRVYRKAGAQPTCREYEIEFSNAIYG
jgi:hypothetical protein